MTQTCFDTLAGGPFLIGPTVGLFWELGSVANLIVPINTAARRPHFTFNFDFAAGFGFRDLTPPEPRFPNPPPGPVSLTRQMCYM